VSLTDHDCTGGNERFMAACEKAGDLVGIPGVEISAEVDRGTMHMLGYFVTSGNRELEAALERIRGGREARNREILAKLNRLGLTLTWEEVTAFAGDEVVGRPHFAQAMVKKGHVPSNTKAFDRYLARGKPAYVDRFRFSPADSIAAIAGAGGVAVLAHPFTLQLDREALRARVAEFREMGLQGVREYRELADELGLVATGGSDFHGDLNPAIKLGKGFGNLRVADETVERLRAASRAAPIG
jgi:predicted metal-dependent phosphoesterase TrpH